LKSKDLIIDSIVNEIYLRSNELTDNINSVYLGGGTPSIISEHELEKIFSAIHKKFNISKNAEITIECNPDDISSEKIEVWKKNGINRVSLGVQSFFDSDLVLMNRSHNSKAAINSIKKIKNNFNNFSIDLIYGIPHSSFDQWKKNIETALQYDVPHISTYVLTVEPKTALKKLIENKKIKEVKDTDQKLQFEFVYDLLTKMGYSNYEFSSFAKPGYECKNNLTYWKREKYIGFGPSAHSFDGTTRKWNISNNHKYIEKIKVNKLPQESETLSEIDILNETIMIGLRTSDGVDLESIKFKFSNLNLDSLIKQIDHKVRVGALIKTNNILYPSKDYKFLTDGLASDLFLSK